jgi:hypothetical protein
MRPVMHIFHGFFGRGFNQTEYIFPFLVYPVGHAFAAEFALVKQVFAMRFSNILCFDTGDNMNIHVDGHCFLLKS